MGKVLSVIVRPIKNYNVQNRAHRFLDQNEPIAAPRHGTPRKISNTNGNISTEVQHKKDDLLLEKLKGIYVVSNTNRNKKAPTAEDISIKTLPRRGQVVNDSDSRFFEPTKIPRGKVTLSQALELITQHESNKQDLPEIAQQYQLDEELTQNLLKHFATFHVHVPQGKNMANSSMIRNKFFPKQQDKKLPEIEP